MDTCITAVLDSNAVDPLIDDPATREVIAHALDEDRLRLLYTHVTLDELVATAELARRRNLVDAVTSFAEKVPTGAFVFDVSRLGEARLSEDAKDFETLGGLTNAKDALIATTAMFENALFVTSDRRAASRARMAGLEVCSMEELCELLT